MPTVLERAAQMAVAQHPGKEGTELRVLATRTLREKTGCDVQTGIRAVDWAIANRILSAAEMPDGSVVATELKAWIKMQHPKVENQPVWLATGDDGLPWALNRDIDRLLAAGEAAVLRVGSGA